MFSDPNTAITPGDRSDTIEHINLLYVLYLCQQIQQQYACKLISTNFGEDDSISLHWYIMTSQIFKNGLCFSF